MCVCNAKQKIINYPIASFYIKHSKIILIVS